MLKEIENFLGLLETPPATRDDRLKALEVALDNLSAAFHALPKGVVGSDQERPDPEIDEYKYFRMKAAEAFPDFGFYPSCDPRGDIAQQVDMGDAIDDLADIALDLTRGLWEWRNNGPAQGAWYLQLHYGVHWGRHLHELRYYLYCQLYRG